MDQTQACRGWCLALGRYSTLQSWMSHTQSTNGLSSWTKHPRARIRLFANSMPTLHFGGAATKRLCCQSSGRRTRRWAEWQPKCLGSFPRPLNPKPPSAQNAYKPSSAGGSQGHIIDYMCEQSLKFGVSDWNSSFRWHVCISQFRCRAILLAKVPCDRIFNKTARTSCLYEPVAGEHP